MNFIPKFPEEKELAFQAGRAAQLVSAQRWLILVSGTVYCMAGIWVAARSGGQFSVLGDTSLALLAFTFVLFGSSYLRFVQDRAELIPILTALAYSVHITLGTMIVADGGGPRFAILAALLLVFLAIISPTLLIGLASISAAIAISVLVSTFMLPVQPEAITVTSAFAYLVPTAALATTVSYLTDRIAREAYTYKWELSRRATTDELSGVANKTHIRVLANNEFSRARRYREPFSCLMFEIDGLGSIRDSWGDHAADTVARVFAGYCVLVMRHCDSLGRLSERRFLALLPETPGPGALVLAQRMVSDLRSLDVNVYGEVINFTVSVGVAEMNNSDESGNALLKRAERGLEDAIEQGREQAVMAPPPPAPPEPIEDVEPGPLSNANG